ncbi:MAG: response regulator transcription factor [Verrucomicrobia bacterium]|nr:response regulator transcription factor [Verrucomicrobiota bacterium]
MKPARIRILVVDDHFMVRLGLRGAFAAEADLELVGEARNGAEALALFPRLRPDVTLMDGILPDIHGVEVTQRLVAQHPGAHIIVVSINETAEDIHRALEAGAMGYLPKSAEKEQLVRAIRAVAGGERFLPPELARRVAERNLRVTLSARETEVLVLIAHGRANKEIAAVLNLSEATVKTHIAHILAKLDAPDRTRAVTLAIERGLLRM